MKPEPSSRLRCDHARRDLFGSSHAQDTDVRNALDSMMPKVAARRSPQRRRIIEAVPKSWSEATV